MATSGLNRAQADPPAMDRPVVIAGLGLMGGSLAAALSQRQIPVRLHARRSESMTAAAARGWGEAAPDLKTACRDAAIVVVCAPVSVIPTIAREAAEAGTAIITDIGSTKLTLQQALSDLHNSSRYIGSHPMCGSHHQGLEHANPGLFTDARVVVTPARTAASTAVAAIHELWQHVGARIIEMSAEEHDHAVANASHLPHVLAAACAAMLDDRGLEVAATGFRDTSRVAAGDPHLWADILLENKNAVREQLIRTRSQLAALEDALNASDRNAVHNWLERGAQGRQRFDQRP